MLRLLPFSSCCHDAGLVVFEYVLSERLCHEKQFYLPAGNKKQTATRKMTKVYFLH